MSAATRGRLAVLAAQLFAEAPAAFGGLVLRGRASPARAALLEIAKAALASGAPWRRVPAGIDDDRLIGGLDLMAALSDGAARLRPGLLADADGGVAVLASAERMPAARAGRITAALDDGHVQIERDGRSLRSPTQFGFIALDEGEDEERAPPALYERAAFLVDMEGVSAAAVADGPMTIEPGEMVSDDAAIAAIIGCARALGVGSARAPIAALRAARALAGRAGRAGLCAGDLELAAALVLAPRATIAPDAEPTQQDPPPPPPDGPEPDPEDQPDPQDQTAEATPPPQALDDLVVAAARAAIPDQLLAALASGAMRGAGGGQGAQTASKLRGRPIGVRAGLPRNGARLALLATLRAAAPWQRLRRAAAGDRAPSAPVLLNKDDLRIRRFAERSEASIIFIVDASGSAALQRLAEVKGAIELILADAYAARTHVAVVTFRKHGAEVLAPPTRSLSRARALLAALPSGGATPLAAGLEAGFALALAERAKGRTVLALTLSDGRANVALDGARDRAQAASDALAAARRFRAAGIAAVVVDTGRWPAPENAALAEAMGARYAPLPFADAAAMKALAAP